MPSRLTHPRDLFIRLYRRAGRELDALLFDRRLGVDTGGVIALPEHGEGAQPYEAVRWLVLRRLLAGLELGEGDVLLDAGCGKGRIVLQTALSAPVRKVVGFDISTDLIEIARTNLAAVHDRLRCDAVGLYVADATQWRIDDEVTVIVASNPFSGVIFETFVAEIIASVDRRPRQVRFLYVWPHSRAAVERTGRFRIAWLRTRSLLGPETCLFEIGPDRG